MESYGEDNDSLTAVNMMFPSQLLKNGSFTEETNPKLSQDLWKDGDRDEVRILSQILKNEQIDVVPESRSNSPVPGVSYNKECKFEVEDDYEETSYDSSSPAQQSYVSPVIETKLDLDAIPIQEEYQFEHDKPSVQPFRVTVAPQNRNSKNLDYVFTVLSDKNVHSMSLFCRVDVDIPLCFHRCKNALSANFITLKLEYLDKNMAGKIVQRCPYHRSNDDSPLRNNVLQCHHEGDIKIYHGGEDEGFPVKLTLPSGACDQAAELRDTINFTFHCMNSCQGGINRRGTRLVFTLRDDCGNTFSYTLNLKICAIPLRDATRDIRRDIPHFVELLNPEVALMNPKKRPHAHVIQAENGIKDGVDQVNGGEQFEQASRNRKPSHEQPARRQHRIAEKENVEDSDKVYEVHVQGQRQYQEVMSFLAKLAKEERYEGLKSATPGVVNPLKDISKIDRKTEVAVLLDHINLLHHRKKFEKIGVHTMQQLAVSYHKYIFEHMGLPLCDCTILHKVFLNWHNTITAAKT